MIGKIMNPDEGGSNEQYLPSAQRETIQSRQSVSKPNKDTDSIVAKQILYETRVYVAFVLPKLVFHSERRPIIYYIYFAFKLELLISRSDPEMRLRQVRFVVMAGPADCLPKLLIRMLISASPYFAD
jgi:hypothetical protein